MPPQDSFGHSPGPAQSAGIPVLQQGAFFSGMPLDSYGMHSPQLFPVTSVPYSQGAGAYHGALGVPYPQPLYPCGEMYGFPSPQPVLDVQTSQQFHYQHMLLDARSLFEELDKQLKSIDRHRAMNNHDPNLAEQRMAIVQQRAEAKNSIAWWEEKLAREAAAHPPRFMPQQGTTFNVRAASYVPLTSTQAGPAMPLSAINSMESNTDSFNSAGTAYMCPTKVPRRAIPIVAPPKASPSEEQDNTPTPDNTPSSPESQN